MEGQWRAFRQLCEESWTQSGLVSLPDWPGFSSRLDTEFRRPSELLWELYRDRFDFALQAARLVEDIFRAYQERSPVLRERDRTRTPESFWS